LFNEFTFCFWTIPGQTLTGVGAAAGIGLINSVGNLSGFTGPYLTGYLYTTTGTYTVAFLAIAGFVAMGGLGLLLLAKLKSDSLKVEQQRLKVRATSTGIELITMTVLSGFSCEIAPHS